MNDIYQIIEKAISERWITIPYEKDKIVAHISVALHNAGYRKQSDTIKEFAEKALALCCKHHYSIAKGFEQVLSETAADLAAQLGKTIKHIQRGELMTSILEYLEDLYNSGNLSDEEWLDLKNLVEEANNEAEKEK